MQYQELIQFCRDNWIFPHKPTDADIQTAIEEYKRCKRASDDEYKRWLKYEKDLDNGK